ncbi:chain length determinant protein [Erythrobacter sp. SD-21]|nr:Wzz/FepE/Etk N-terminal domain-containing protein [Erythrobacter sp. SD-21]EDL49315.1 chain length determinant protein [Erythrobacter sp. SD-21]
MNLAQVSARLWRAKGFILASAVFCGGAALGISFTIPDQYFATAGVQIEDVVQSDVQSYSVSNKQIDEYVKTKAELARDFRVTGRVVDRLGWTGNYDLAQRFNREAAGSGLDFRAWLARGIREGVVLRFEEGSPSFQIGFAGYTPAEAQFMAGLVRDEFLSYTLEDRRSEAEKNAEFADRRIRSVRQQLEALEKRNAEFAREANIVLTPDGTSMAEVQLTNAVSASEPVYQGAAPTPTVPNPALRELAAVEGELAQLSGVLGPNHPQIVELQKRRAELQAAASRPTAQPSSGPSRLSNNAISDMREREYIEKADAIATAKRYFDETQALRQQFEDLTRTREGYDFDAETIQGGAIAVGAPRLEEGVFYPNRPFAAAAGFGFGLIFAALVSLWFSLLQLKVATPRDLEWLDVQRIGTKPDRSTAVVRRAKSNFALPSFRKKAT